MRRAVHLLVPLVVVAACGGEGTDAPAPAENPDMSAEADPTSTPELVGAWTVEYIDDRPVIDRSPAYFEFDGEGQVAGSATCNRVTGSYIQEGPAIVIRPLAVTRRMCPEALMEQEQRFLEALDRVRSWQIENEMLILEDADGGPVFRASSRAPGEG